MVFLRGEIRAYALNQISVLTESEFTGEIKCLSKVVVYPVSMTNLPKTSLTNTFLLAVFVDTTPWKGGKYLKVLLF